MVDLKVDLGNNLVLDNPVLTASGTFGYGTEFDDFIDLNRLIGFELPGFPFPGVTLLSALPDAVLIPHCQIR